jgi:hypothetical protein
MYLGIPSICWSPRMMSFTSAGSSSSDTVVVSVDVSVVLS